jgi:2-polyprenyl-6-methoxyphenol hydroxylase-like FAD-dependent oxidoreductase
MARHEYDIAVIGGGMGGVAAALAAVQAGARVILTEATSWLGGQMTSQGVSAFDEHALIESFGGTRSYYELRNGIRSYYREKYGAPVIMPDGAPLNPGNGWVSRLCFEPKVGLQVIEKMLAEHILSGKLTVLLEHEPVEAEVKGDQISAVALRSRNGEVCSLHAPDRLRIRHRR